MTSSNAAAHLSVELLVVPDCPHEAAARVMIETVLNDLEVPARISTTIVDTDDQARDLQFVGSPTFLINGQDPFADAEAAVGLACRMYRTPDGMDGVPPLSSLREAIGSAAERGASC
ncbi:DF family (seleno)protein [Nocardioides aurantiacus]|uniref:DF family (seleno)protein n=1 Tax=Nocardioides aurantiacus TaxID=86796 RepID=UPI00403FB320